MARKGFDFFRAFEAVGKIGEELSGAACDDETAQAGRRQAGTARQSSKKQDSRERGPQTNLSEVAGLAALGLAAFAKHKAGGARSSNAEAQERKRTRTKKSGHQKVLLEGFRREIDRISEGRRLVYRNWERTIEATERSVANRN